MIELYHWEPTSNSGEPLILLKERGADFTGRYVDVLGFEHLSPDFLKLNPAAQVPVLVHDGRVLTETGFILQYLDAVLPGPSLTPKGVQDRYWVNVWIKYVQEYMAPAAWKLGVRQRFAAQMTGRDLNAAREALKKAPLERQQAWARALADDFSDDELEAAKGLLPVRLERMETALQTSDWLAGPDYSLADIVVFPTANALPALVPDLVSAQATPRIIAWLERMRARPAVKAALAMGRSPKPETMFAPGPEGSRWG